MPGPQPVMVDGDEALPAKVDVVVMGGGIIGTTTAPELSEAGLAVALCEKGWIAHEQSSRNWGWVRIARRDPREVPLMAEALRQWRGMAARVGRDVGYRGTAISFVCATDKDVETYRRWQRHLGPFQIPSRILTRAEPQEMAPGGEIDGVGALLTPATAAPSRRRRARGAAILTNCAVRGVEISGGAVSGVVTEHGAIACSSVVVAGGAWRNLFCGNVDLDLPQLGVISHVMRTNSVEGGPDGAMWIDRFAIRRREDGGYTISRGSGNTVDIVPDSFRYAVRYLSALRMQRRDLHFRVGRRFFHEARRKRRWSLDEASPFEAERILDPTPSPRMLKNLLDEAARVFPTRIGSVRCGMGFRDVTRFWRTATAGSGRGRPK